MQHFRCWGTKLKGKKNKLILVKSKNLTDKLNLMQTDDVDTHTEAQLKL